MKRASFYRWTGALAVAATTALAAGSGSAQAPELRIGLIPEMNVFEQVERYRRLADYLSRQVDRPIKLTMLSRYGNIVQRMAGNDVDGAFLGSFTGALASAQLGMQPVARPINLDGSSTYWGYIFVRKDSGISSVEQMRGTRLALVERATTAGYVFPVAYFRRSGVDDVDSFFEDVQFWGSHDASIHAVLSGRADVGAAKNTIWERLVQEDPRVERELSILATSPRVPSNGLFISSDVDPSVAEEIRTSLLALHDSPDGAQILSALRVQGFVPTDAKSYEPVMELAREAGIDLAAYSYSNQ